MSVRGKLERLLGSRQFYWGVIAFFVFEALWVALSAKYPMAFDEDFHFGIINIYAHQSHPFLSGQPTGANIYGALAADPSYLYHFLMSWAYRLIVPFADSQMIQVICLRIINIGIITGGVLLLGKTLLRAGTPRQLVGTATLLFALIPTVPLLAAQINYDSLFLLVLAWVCWLTLVITEDVQRRTLRLPLLVALGISLMLASLVKYTFLPLALATTMYAAVVLWRAFGWRRLWPAVAKAYRVLTPGMRIALVILFVFAGGLFGQRYGANLIHYGSPLPDCRKVIGIDACSHYGPWARNYRYIQSKRHIDPNPAAYSWQWLAGMHYRLFFMITGPPRHTNYPPSPLPSAAAVVILLSGTLALIFYGRRVFAARPYMAFLLFLSVTYVGALWFKNYSEFLETGQPVAINGRYVIPLLLPMAAVFGRGLAAATARWPRLRIWAAALAIVLFLEGGGVLGFISRSDDSWYWPGPAAAVNDAARKLVDPLIFEGPKHY